MLAGAANVSLPFRCYCQRTKLVGANQKLSNPVSVGRRLLGPTKHGVKRVTEEKFWPSFVIKPNYINILCANFGRYAQNTILAVKICILRMKRL